MRTITRIYKTGKPRMSTVQMDCGHKTEHKTADIKKWQLFIGKTGMTCPTCDRAARGELTPEEAEKFNSNLEADIARDRQRLYELLTSDIYTDALEYDDRVREVQELIPVVFAREAK